MKGESSNFDLESNNICTTCCNQQSSKGKTTLPMQRLTNMLVFNVDVEIILTDRNMYVSLSSGVCKNYTYRRLIQSL